MALVAAPAGDVGFDQQAGELQQVAVDLEREVDGLRQVHVGAGRAGRVEGLGGEEMRQAPQGGHAALPGRRQHRLVLAERRGEVAGEQRVPADEEVIVRASKGAQPWKIYGLGLGEESVAAIGEQVVHEPGVRT